MSVLSRDERGNLVLVQFARILAIVGILIILSSPLLPGGLFTPRSEYYLRVFLGIIRIFLYAMGLFWLTFLAASRKVRAVSAVIWGSLVLLLTSLDAAMAVSDSIGNGTFLTILGSLALIAGSAFVYMKTEKAVKTGPVSLVRSVPPSP